MTRKLLDDCFLHDKDRLTHEQAIDLLRSRIAPISGHEKVPLKDAVGRALATPITAENPIPGHDNAAVDGYVFAHEDYDIDKGSRFEVSGRAAAGHPLKSPPPTGTAVRIFTGAVVPPELDTIVMQEDIELADDGAKNASIIVPPGLKQGANRRRAGEDVQKGEKIFHQGHRIRPQDLAAAASAGNGEVNCFERLKVAIFSTGDEIIRPGSPIGLGQVYDANAPMLEGLIATTGAECIDLGIIPDNAEIVEKTLRDAASKYDVIITSGGASRGEEDYVVSTLDKIGKRHMWQIAVKPGRPMSMGQIEDTIFIGLPGNPVAVFVCFLLYAYPILCRLGGMQWLEPRRFKVPAAFNVPKKKTGRREFWRGYTKLNAGELYAHKFERDGSGLITSLREANGLIEVAEDVSEIGQGDLIDFIPFSEFGIS